MQLYWLSPIVIFPLWLNWKYGIAWWSIIFSILTGIMGWVTKACVKPPTGIFGAVKYVGHEIERPDICGKACVSGDFAPFLRAQPYMIGLLVGWVFYKTKGKKIKIPHVSYCSKLGIRDYINK